MNRKILFVRPRVRYPVGQKEELGLPQSYLTLSQFLINNSMWQPTIIDYRLDKLLGIAYQPEKDFYDEDVIAVGCSTNEFPQALELLKIAKKMGKITILGGVFPTQNVEYCLSYNAIDFVVGGEGEKALCDLLVTLESGYTNSDLSKISNLSFVIPSSNKIVCIPRSKLLPSITEVGKEAYSLINLNNYAKFVSAHIMATRGCPYSCDHCSLKEIWGKKYRERCIDNVIKEMIFLKNAGFNRVHLKDESLTVDVKYCKELFGAIAKAELGLGIKLKSRIDGIEDDGLLKLMRTAGVDYIHLGVESISDTLLKRMKKGGSINKKMIESVLNMILENDININPVFIIGVPQQTADDLDETVSFIKTLGQSPRVIAYASFWTPHPVDGKFSIADDLVLLENNIHRFTHKQPVAVPTSLNTINGREKMVQSFHDIADYTGNRDVNPMISINQKESFVNAQEIINTKIPLY